MVYVPKFASKVWVYFIIGVELHVGNVDHATDVLRSCHVVFRKIGAYKKYKVINYLINLIIGEVRYLPLTL